MVVGLGIVVGAVGLASYLASFLGHEASGLVPAAAAVVVEELRLYSY